MRRNLAPALALVVLLSACGSDEPTERPSPRETPSASAPSVTVSATPVPTTEPPVSPSPFSARCTLVLGFSVTRDWYLEGAFETRPGIEDGRWELIYADGHDVWLFADPGAQPYSMTPSSPCAAEPDRALYQVAARGWESHTPEELVAALGSAIENIRATWPTVRVVELIPIVGGPGGGPCEGDKYAGSSVEASAMNPAVNAAIAEVADGLDVRAGPDLTLADCAQYRDGQGHTTPDGSSYIASVLAEHYGT